MAGFLTAWNLWVYAISATASVVFVLPTDLAYLLGPSRGLDSGQQVGHLGRSPAG